MILTLIQSESTVVPPVTAERSPPALANDGRGLAGDRQFIDRRDAFDDLAIAGNEIAGLDENDVADSRSSAETPSTTSLSRSLPDR